MAKFSYEALDSRGKETKGTIDVDNQAQAINRIKEMGLHPIRIVEIDKTKPKQDKAAKAADAKGTPQKKGLNFNININIKIPFLSGKVKPKVLTAFTRQLATLVDAGLPLLRGLRVLERQERNPTLRKVINDLAISIEAGSTFSEALAQHPKIFNRLFVNMVRAGELGGVLEVVLNRLAEFMEKAQRIKGKVVAAMFYPCAVIIVATVILGILMVYVVPKFKAIFKDLLGPGKELPQFTQIVLGISDAIANHFIITAACVTAFIIMLNIFIRTKAGRKIFDRFKLNMPVVGPVLKKAAIARFTRTLGTLVSSGVPILQALTIVKETSGNAIVADAIAAVHESVKEGETITAPLELSGIFPPMVISMVDVGEQTGALPEMLMKIADTYDDEVDNAVAAMTSLLEPIMIVFLAVIVGSIVIALFLPLISIIDQLSDSGAGGGED
ncbi:MAG TPA: type II secretion system F family protein [Verrucomicrobiota bacterium]|nr:type II secretion system F family protein [Verrucomicrobiota bacterium]